MNDGAGERGNEQKVSSIFHFHGIKSRITSPSCCCCCCCGGNKLTEVGGAFSVVRRRRRSSGRIRTLLLLRAYLLDFSGKAIYVFPASSYCCWSSSSPIWHKKASPHDQARPPTTNTHNDVKEFARHTKRKFWEMKHNCFGVSHDNNRSDKRRKNKKLLKNLSEPKMSIM